MKHIVKAFSHECLSENITMFGSITFLQEIRTKLSSRSRSTADKDFET